MFNIVISDDQQTLLSKLEQSIKKITATLDIQVNEFASYNNPDNVISFSQLYYKDNT
jgi:hypothetical protein